MNEKILEKLKDKEFLEKIFSLKTKEEIMKAFSQENIEVTDAEIEQLGNLIAQTVSKLSDMPESELEKVSGGDVAKDIKNLTEEWASVMLAPAVGIAETVSDATSATNDNAVGTLFDTSTLKNLTFVGVAALEAYGIYKLSPKIASGAKWTFNKGKVGASWIGNKVKDTWNARKK